MGSKKSKPKLTLGPPKVKEVKEFDKFGPVRTVLWSGGADSTLVLYNLCKEASEDKYGFRKVRALTVIHPEIVNSGFAKRVREDILERLKGKFKFQVEYHVVSIRSTFGVPQQSGIEQCVFWLGLSVPYLRGEEDLFMGYIRGDDFWHYRESAVLAFNNLQVLAGHKGRLCLPLEWARKGEVLEKLDKLKLRTWSCEYPTKRGRPCGKCHPCLVLKAAKLGV